MIVLYHPDNLHRGICTLYSHLLTDSLIIGSETKVTYSCLVDNQLVNIIAILF